MKQSVYQNTEFLHFQEKSGNKIVKIAENFHALERRISFPGLGSRKIIEARGNPTDSETIEFKKLSKKYFYGTIAKTVISDSLILDKVGFFKVSNATILIDTTKSLDALWQGLEKKSSRWGVKTAQKNNLILFETQNKEDISNFYKIYLETAEKGKFKPENESFISDLASSNIAKLFVIKLENEVLCGGLVLLDKDYNYTILDLTAASEKGLSYQAMPFLYWKIIEFSKINNFLYLDLGGYDSNSSSDKMIQINKFKERFGGIIVEQPIYSTNRKYPLLRKLKKSSNFLGGLYNKK